MKDIELLNGDCLKTLKEMPDDSVDIVVTSPPYNQLGSRVPEHLTGMFKTAGWGKKIAEKGYFDDRTEDEYQAWIREIITECLRVAKGLVWVNHKTRYRDGIAIHPLHFLGDFPMYAEIVWDRGGSMALNCKRFAPSNEYFFAFGKPHYWDDRFNKLCSVWRIPPHADPGAKNHPCPYPEKLIKPIIIASCPEDGIVFDPFTGSGTTAIAATKLNRRFIGTEIDPRFYELAQRRLVEVQAQMSLGF